MGHWEDGCGTVCEVWELEPPLVPQCCSLPETASQWLMSQEHFWE